MMRRYVLSLMLLGAMLQTSLAFAQGNLPGLPPLADRFDESAPAVGERLPDLTILDDQGNRVNMRELPAPGRYTVLTVGCLT